MCLNGLIVKFRFCIEIFFLGLKIMIFLDLLFGLMVFFMRKFE